MLRHKACILGAALGVLLSAGIAFAAANKLALDPYAPNGPLEPDASGQAVLNYAKGRGQTIVQINCWDLTPVNTYDVYLYDGAIFDFIGSFTTRKNGSGNFHVVIDGDVSTDDVAINDAGLNATVLCSPGCP